MTVQESGFTYNPYKQAATAGVVLRNSSAEWDSDEFAQVTINYNTASGIGATETDYVGTIPAGATAYFGNGRYGVDVVGGPVTSVSAFVSCHAAPRGAATGLITGTGTSYWRSGDVEVRGQFTNTYPFTMEHWSSIGYVTRDNSGRITGGGQDLTESDLAPGLSVSWDDWATVLTSTSQATTVQFSVEPSPA